MKVLITGGNGQLGWELQRTAPREYDVIALNRQELDITDVNAVMSVTESARPDAVINAAAYTAVDRAEQERDRAYAANATGAANVAQAAASIGARLIHISTDFVFDGTKPSPYLPEDKPNPLSVYGASKLKGEKCVYELGYEQALIIRTSWVYSSHGNNFVKTILRLLNERDSLNVVSDQIGTPTWAKVLADTIWMAIAEELTGVHHWTDAGVASWYDFAVAVQDEALTLGMTARDKPILPIRTKDYPTPALRPAYSILDKSSIWEFMDISVIHWRKRLRSMLMELSMKGMS